MIFSIILSVFCLLNFHWGLPMVDFRPFAEGVNIPVKRMECEQDAPQVARTYYYVNSKSGDEQKITSKQLTEEYQTYKYLYTDKDDAGNNIWSPDTARTKDVVLNKGCDSKVKEMDESKQHTFATHGYSFLVVADDLNKASKKGFKEIAKIATAALKDDVQTHALYYHIEDKNKDGNYEDDVDRFRNEISTPFDFTQSDEKLVKTIIRSSPGLLLLYNGTIVKKWHHRQLPSYDFIKINLMNELEPSLELVINIEDYSPDATIHNFSCKVQQVAKGNLAQKEIKIAVLDGNDLLLKTMTTSDGATSSRLKVTLAPQDGLVPANEKLNFVPNGFLDTNRQAWQIISVDKI